MKFLLTATNPVHAQVRSGTTESSISLRKGESREVDFVHRVVASGGETKLPSLPTTVGKEVHLLESLTVQRIK